MALYRCATLKEGVDEPYVGQRWRNVYTLEAADYGAALAAADVLGSYEMTFHTDKVRMYAVTAHLVTEPPHRVGAQLASIRPGEYVPSGDAWPLWNCLRIDFQDVGVGRPERKYYRVGLHDGMVTPLLTLLGTYLSPTVNDGADLIANLANYVGPSGEGHSGFLIHNSVQMRQQGWHRRNRPGFVRGYVAV